MKKIINKKIVKSDGRVKVLVCGAGGFIGGNLVKFLKDRGYCIRGVDIKINEFQSIDNLCDEFIIGDLRDPKVVGEVLENIDHVYQLAADMGGAGFVFTGENDADIMHNSALINLNIGYYATKKGIKKIFYSSSACMYPVHNQLDPANPNCEESSAYPANPDSEYGWEKLFSERLFLSFMKNKGIEVRIARYHNIFGPYGTYEGGREKAPAAICRKIVEANEKDKIEIWGSGNQTRSFLYIDECLEATYRLMNSSFTGPVNIGSEEMISINDLAKMIIKISGKNLQIDNIQGDRFEKKYGHKCPVGVNGRNSNNNLYKNKIGWSVSQPLVAGIEKTYKWIKSKNIYNVNKTKKKYDVAMYGGAIRVDEWEFFYKSLKENNNCNFIIFFCGHVRPKFELPDNFVHIYSKMTVAPCVEIARRFAMKTNATYIHEVQDDMLYTPAALDKMIEIVKSHKEEVVISPAFKPCEKTPPINLEPLSDASGLNLIFMKKEIAARMGGVDSRFKGCFYMWDQVLRLQSSSNVKFFVTPEDICVTERASLNHKSDSVVNGKKIPRRMSISYTNTDFKTITSLWNTEGGLNIKRGKKEFVFSKPLKRLQATLLFRDDQLQFKLEKNVKKKKN
jgi:GDP-D-mannose 3', 5'-epimerase